MRGEQKIINKVNQSSNSYDNNRIGSVIIIGMTRFIFFHLKNKNKKKSKQAQNHAQHHLQLKENVPSTLFHEKKKNEKFFYRLSIS